MKKSYLILAAVAGLLASCTQNEEIVKTIDEPVAISFENGFINNQTRAELVNNWFTTDGNKFGVFGYKGTQQIFGTSASAAEPVTWEASKSDWTNPTLRFWDKAATYSFYAYAPFAATTSIDAGKFTFTGLSLIKDVTTDNADVAISNPVTGDYDACTNCVNTNTTGHGTSHVEFTFNHILSKLAFKAMTTTPTTDATITVKKIEVDFPTATATSWAQTAASGVAGTTSFTDYTAKDGTNYETVVYNNTTGTVLGTTTPTSTIGNQYIVAPVNTTNTEHVFGVKVTYDLKHVADNVTETNCVAYGVVGGGSTEATQYKPGQNDSYVILIKIGREKIEFCVNKITDWNTDTVREITVE